VSDNLLLDLKPEEVELIRSALRLQEEDYKRNGFTNLQRNVQVLRSLISSAVIDNVKELTRG
jgi:hypothetical protein